MGKGYLIDSNVVIDYLNNKLPAPGLALINRLVDDKPNISVITKIEILRFNGSTSIYDIFRDLIHESNILELNDAVVDKTIAICKSRRIKLPDAIIEATAITHNYILVTRNTSDFLNIKGLKLLNSWIVADK